MDIYKYTTPMWTIGDDAFDDLFPEPPTNIDNNDEKNGRQHQSVERLESFDDFLTFEMPFMYGFEQRRPQQQIVKPKCEAKILPEKMENENPIEVEREKAQEHTVQVPKGEVEVIPKMIDTAQPSEEPLQMTSQDTVSVPESLDLIIPTISAEKILDQQQTIIQENVRDELTFDQPQDGVMPETETREIKSKPEVKAPPAKPIVQRRRTFPTQPPISRHQKAVQSADVNSEPQNKQQKFKEELMQMRKRQQIQKFLRNQNYTKDKTTTPIVVGSSPKDDHVQDKKEENKRIFPASASESQYGLAI